jgi:hypothetical protein
MDSVALFETEKFEDAKRNFETALQKRQEQFPNKDTANYIRYIRKCDVEIAGKEWTI